MYPPRAAGLAFSALLVGCGAWPLLAQDLSPLTPADEQRVEQLLKGFDPNSYQLRTQVARPDGSLQLRSLGEAKGLTSLQQVETQRAVAAAPAKTNNTINIFRDAAKTNNTINIFREAAGTNNTINLFRDEKQQQSALEINSILQKYVNAPAAPQQLAAPSRMRVGMAPRQLASPAQNLKPLSAGDQARIETLLQAFDPNSYQLSTQVANQDGSIQPRSIGEAKGLASLQQVETLRPGMQTTAGTNNTINIYRQAAGTNNTINLFREAAGTNNTINVFRDATQQQNAMEINSILQKYLGAP
jgi:hypothetical protein